MTMTRLDVTRTFTFIDNKRAKQNKVYELFTLINYRRLTFVKESM